MHPRQRAPQHYLSGLVHCGICGDHSYVTTTDPDNPKASFRCRVYATKGKEECPGTFILRSTVENQLGLWLAGHQVEVLTAAAEAGLEKPEVEAEVTTRRREVERLEEALARLLRRYAVGDVDDTAYKQAASGLEQDLSKARSALADAYTTLDTSAPVTQDEYEKLCAPLTTHPEDAAVWRATLGKVVEGIWVYPTYWEIRPRHGEVTRFPR